MVAKKKTSAVKKTTTKKSSVKKSKKKEVSVSENNPEPVYNLSSVLAINDIADLYKSLNEYLEYNSPVILSAKSVEMIDTAVLQMLAAFIEEMEETNQNNRGL